MGGRRLLQRHAYPAPAYRRHQPPRPPPRQSDGARRPFGLGVPGELPGFRLSPRRRAGGRHGGAGGAAQRKSRKAAASGRPQDGGAQGAVAVSDAGLRVGRDRSLHARHRPVLLGLPLPLRVLRHSRLVRARAAPQVAGADLRRARQAAGARRQQFGLFRRRQHHRQPQGDQGPPAPSDRLAEAQRLRDQPLPARRRSTSPARRTCWR